MSTPAPDPFLTGRLTEGVSQQSIALDAAVFVLGFLILGGILVWIGRKIFTAKD
jgi:hypothetical protein